MHLKASKCLTVVVVLYVSFSYPVVSVRRSISSKPNQMSPVLMRVHVAKSSSGLFLRLVSSFYLLLDGFGELLSVRLGALYRVLGLVGLRYRSPLAAVL